MYQILYGMSKNKAKYPIRLTALILALGTIPLVLLSSFGTKKRYVHHKDFNVTHIKQGFANVYVAQQGDKIVMIDSGNPEKSHDLESRLLNMGINPKSIEYLILTHAHPDHAGNARYFQEKYGMQILSGIGEKEIIANQGEDGNLCPIGFMGTMVGKTIAKERYAPFETDIYIKDEFDLKTLGFDGIIVPFPGHTPGSLIVYLGDAVFVGDIIRGKTLNKKKPTRHLFVCDFDQNLANIEAISKLKGVKHWYPGHGGPLVQEDVKQFINKEKSK